MHKQNGIGLVSVLVLIVGIGIIVAVASPIAITMIQEARMRATLHEMRLLSEAIALYHPDEAGGFGFVGDVGRFPTSLRELVENYNYPPLPPPWSIATGIGWQGPYIERGFVGAPADAYRQDEWGNLYDYVSATGIITSFGSDGAAGGTGYAADFSTENLTPRRFGIIRGQARDILGAPLGGVEVSVEEPVDGAATWRTPVTTDGAGFYSLSGVIVGRRRLRATFTARGVTHTHYLHTVVTPHLEARADFDIAVDVTIPQAPTGLTVTPEVFGGISLDWLPPTSNIDGSALTDLAGFNIYRHRQLSFPFTGFTPAPENRIATLGPVHFFHDRTVSSHYIYHYIVRAFDKAGNESANATHPTTDSFSTANGVGNIRQVARAMRWGTRNITVGIRNFSAADITVEEVRVSWTGGPTEYTGIWTRIPTSASWTIVSRDETANGEAVFLDWPGFTLNAYGTTNYEGIFRVGFNTTMPVGTLITIVLNPGPGESRFDVIW